MRRLNMVALIGIVLLIVLIPGTGVAPVVSAQETEFRSGQWTQSTALQFAAGQKENVEVTVEEGGQVRLVPGAVSGTFTSLVFRTDLVFNSLAALWDVELPEGASVEIDLRAFAGADGWTPWQPLINVEWIPNKQRYAPEAPLMFPGGEQLQYRVRMQAGAGGSPALREITVLYMDTSIGPNTTQAKRRTEFGPATVQGVPKPPIILRAGWGADESLRNWDPEYGPVEKIIVHHTVTPNDYTEDKAAEWVRSIYYYHAVSLDWGDIGYNYVVDRYGNIYEGRYGGPGVVGGHVYHYNYGSMGVSLMGTHGNMSTAQTPTLAALDALVRLSTWEASRSYIHPLERAPFGDAYTDNLAGHRDYPPYQTSCPGDLAYAELPGVRQAVWDRLISIIPRYEVEWLSWEAPDSALEDGVLEPETTYTLSVQVRNSGWLAWANQGTNRVRLGYHWLDAAGNPVVQPPAHDHRAELPAAITFGHTVEFPSVQVTTPSAPGQYTLAWDMVQEGIVWFHDANPQSPRLELPLTVLGEDEPDPDAVYNGGFESDGGWVLFETAYPARYTTHVRRSGVRAMQTGIENAAENVYSYSSTEQVFRVPSEQGIRLRYWHQGPVDAGDYAYVMLQPEGGGWRILLFDREGVANWALAEHDLSAFAGQVVRLRFGTYNDGRGGVSAMYVDDVSTTVGDVPPVTPDPTRTPAPAPTATPTLTPSPTQTPTPSPTPTPSGGGSCIEVVQNGGFDSGGGWLIYETPATARLTDAFARSAPHSLQVGIAQDMVHEYSYSSAEQRLSIPAGRAATLELWYTIPDAGGSGDYGYLLYQTDGGTWRYLDTLRDQTPGWQRIEFDMSDYAGQTITLRVGMRNDGRTLPMVMYVDDVSLLACLP